MVEKCRIIGENVRSIITPPCYKGFRPFPRRFLVFPSLLYRAERRCSIPKKRLNVSRRFPSIVCVVSSFRRDAFAETPVLLRPRLTHFICCFRFFHRKCSVFRQTTVVGIQGLFRSAGLQLFVYNNTIPPQIQHLAPIVPQKCVGFVCRNVSPSSGLWDCSECIHSLFTLI